MSFRSMMKFCVTAVLITGSFAVYASEPVLCPSVELVKSKWQHLDTVEVMKDSLYMVRSEYGSIFDENSKRWWAVVTVVNAPDFNTAFSNGQENVKNATIQVDKYAKESAYYACEYKESASLQSIYMFAEIRESGGKIKRFISQLSK